VPLPVTGRVDRCWDVVPAGRREHSFIRSQLEPVPVPPERSNLFRIGNASEKLVQMDWLKRLQAGHWTPGWFHDQNPDPLMGAIQCPRAA
jgi:hypothetical protein